MKKNTNTTTEIPTAVLAAVENLRVTSPVIDFDWSDEEADTFCELTADIYGTVGDDEDTLCETHRDFVIVWNRCGVWRVDLKAKTITDVL